MPSIDVISVWHGVSAALGNIAVVLLDYLYNTIRVAKSKKEIQNNFSMNIFSTNFFQKTSVKHILII